MSKAKEEQEPSMEEILSSIRRIIADEQDEDERQDSRSEPDDTLDLGGEHEVAAAHDIDEEADEDIFDLGDVDDTLDAHARLMAESVDEPDDDSEDVDDDPFAVALDDEHDDDPLLDEDDEDEDELLLDQFAAEPEDPNIEPDFEPETDLDLDGEEVDLEPVEMAREPETIAEPEHDTEMETAHVASIAEDDLVSQTAAAASTSAFARLAKAASGDRPGEIAQGSKSVEQFMTELVKPMLKEWLDENLNVIVERVVEQEVKKLARRAELM